MRPGGPCAVDLERRSGSGYVLISSPIIIVNVGVTDFNVERIWRGMRLDMVLRLNGWIGIPLGTSRPHLHEPVQPPTEHIIQISSLVGEVVSC